ncbi:hypothetical protein E3J84_03670 [Candidatus Aerophobetes bacterium]|uniref:Uncharacterized protein n=1 Tax=Aerophobetes bacterium TaxID=2030807 RepID=A0A523RYB5_UNCAE|nr:MAG: hypothetical protein E3J84_03670 [Candidatus Aerophobetes bacterium]
MKKLLYVPIIHIEADLGRVAPIIDKRSSQMCGKERWTQHKKSVLGFWDSIANFFAHLRASNLKIYQDGLMIDGEIGKKIIEEGASKGSKNHKIVLELMEKGAKIMKTEDLSLLKEEYNSIIKLSQTKSFLEKMLVYIGYKLRKNPLMEKRDKFIAERINETLKDGEAGVLFVGAYHNVLPRISKDIIVYELKERSKVKAYFDELVWGKDEKRFKELAEYLASPVKDLHF